MKQYLGDGVYACVKNGMLILTTENLILTTENAFEATNEICLEYEVLQSLLQYVDRLKEEARKRLENLGNYEDDKE